MRLALLFLVACSAPMDVAVRSVNASYEIGMTAQELIREECTEAYNSAKTKEEVDELDRKCLPLRDAFRAYRRAQLAARLAIEAGQEDQASMAALKLMGAAAELAKEIQK